MIIDFVLKTSLLTTSLGILEFKIDNTQDYRWCNFHFGMHPLYFEQVNSYHVLRIPYFLDLEPFKKIVGKKIYLTVLLDLETKDLEIQKVTEL